MRDIRRALLEVDGMRIVTNPTEFFDSFLGAQREAADLFGVNTILLEKYITKPRHIEVQAILKAMPLGISVAMLASSANNFTKIGDSETMQKELEILSCHGDKRAVKRLLESNQS
ncbi:hypothetical protein ACET3Z_027685 [Daucus carota]